MNTRARFDLTMDAEEKEIVSRAVPFLKSSQCH